MMKINEEIVFYAFAIGLALVTRSLVPFMVEIKYNMLTSINYIRLGIFRYLRKIAKRTYVLAI